MKTILNADSGGSTWTVAVSTDPTCLQWARADKATALYDKTKHVLVFTSDDMAEALRKGIPVPPSKPASASAAAPAQVPAPAPAPDPAH